MYPTTKSIHIVCPQCRRANRPLKRWTKRRRSDRRGHRTRQARARSDFHFSSNMHSSFSSICKLQPGAGCQEVLFRLFFHIHIFAAKRCFNICFSTTLLSAFRSYAPVGSIHRCISRLAFFQFFSLVFNKHDAFQTS